MSQVDQYRTGLAEIETLCMPKEINKQRDASIFPLLDPKVRRVKDGENLNNI